MQDANLICFSKELHMSANCTSKQTNKMNMNMLNFVETKSILINNDFIVLQIQFLQFFGQLRRRLHVPSQGSRSRALYNALFPPPPHPHFKTRVRTSNTRTKTKKNTSMYFLGENPNF